MKRIKQLISRIKPRWGAPFSIAKIDVIEDGDHWVRCPRAVALMPLESGEVLVYFEAEGRTFQRFIELAQEQLSGYQFTPGDGHEIAFGILPQTQTPLTEGSADNAST